MTAADIQRKARVLSQSEIVVVPIGPPTCGGIPDAPEFREEMRDFSLLWKGKFMETYQRQPSSGASSGAPRQ
jgi:hypothetical protein